MEHKHKRYLYNHNSAAVCECIAGYLLFEIVRGLVSASRSQLPAYSSSSKILNMWKQQQVS